MAKTIRVVFFFFLFQITLFGCTLCKLDIPNVHINTTITPQINDTKIEIKWKFDNKFLSTLQQYDVNRNGHFDDNEQKEIKKALLDYLVQWDYLTQIAYLQQEYKITQDDIIKLKDIQSYIQFLNDEMEFTYSCILPIVPKNGYKLVVFFYDKGNNFNFIVRDVIVKNYDGKKLLKITNSKAEVIFDDVILLKDDKVEHSTTEPKNTFFSQLSNLLEEYKNRIKTLISEIKETNSLLSYSWLLFFSFVYGIIHAVGPGHGKSLVSAYFFSENHSVKKALSISLLIGIVHTFSAFILTLTVYFILDMLFANIFSDIETIATKISGVIIIFIASYLLYKKYTFKKRMIFSIDKPVHQNHLSCHCGSCSTNSTDLGVVLAAGIVPCAGTVSIFLFTMGLGVYFVGFLSATFMSLGMSLVIFLSAYLSKNIRNKTTDYKKILKFFEYGSLGFMLFLGVLLSLV